MVYMLRALLGSTVLFILLPCQAAQPLVQTFNNTLHGFSISFPEGWIVAPAEKLDELNRQAALQNPELKRPMIHYGYQMTNAPGFVVPPYMVIRVSDKRQDPGAVAAELEKDDLPRGVQRDKPTFNTTSNIISTHFLAETEPPFECFVSYFLTSQGVIKMFFYVAQADHDRFTPLLQQIVDGVEISKATRFEPTQPPPRYGLPIALIAIGAVVVVLYRAKPAAPGK